MDVKYIVSLIVQNLENSQVMRQVVTGLLNKCLTNYQLKYY